MDSSLFRKYSHFFGEMFEWFPKLQPPSLLLFILFRKNHFACKQLAVLLLVSSLECKYFSCLSLLFKTLETGNSSKINTQFWSWFSSRWLWGGTGNEPVASHLVVPRINFLRSVKGYNTKLIQPTLNVCICQSCSILSWNVHLVFSVIVSMSFL